MAGRLLGSAGGVMGAMALIKIFSATSKTGSTLAKVAGTLLNSGGGSGKGSGQGKRSGKGSSGEGSIAESMLAALKELKTNGAEGGNRRKPAGKARGAVPGGSSGDGPLEQCLLYHGGAQGVKPVPTGSGGPGRPWTGPPKGPRFSRWDR